MRQIMTVTYRAKNGRRLSEEYEINVSDPLHRATRVQQASHSGAIRGLKLVKRTNR